MLRADAHEALHSAELLLDGLAEDERIALCRFEEAREHVERGRLAGAIVPEQAEESLVSDANVHAVDCGEGHPAAAAALEGLPEVHHTDRVVVGAAVEDAAHLAQHIGVHRSFVVDDIGRSVGHSG